jgi:hypothetical protein
VRPRHALANARLMLRDGVEERRQDHVAGDTAHGVEMDLRRVLRRGVRLTPVGTDGRSGPRFVPERIFLPAPVDQPPPAGA